MRFSRGVLKRPPPPTLFRPPPLIAWAATIVDPRKATADGVFTVTSIAGMY